LATSKSNKAPRSSTKKLQTKPITSKKPIVSEPTPEQSKAIERLVSGVDSIPWNLPMQEWSPAHRKLRRDVLLSITSDYTSTCQSPEDHPDSKDFLVGNHFAWGASQVNTDLAVAAHCESEEDVHLEDETFFDLCASPEYQKLKQTFMEEAEKDGEDAVMNLVWRAYNAGTYSPERRHPDSREVRQERQRHREKAEVSRRAAKAEREAIASADELLEKLGPEETGEVMI
jgi:hypothetical protein